MSAPATNALSPAPVSTITRTPVSRAAASSAPSSEQRNAPLSALRLSGRLMVRTVTAPRRSSSTSFSSLISFLPAVEALTRFPAQLSLAHHSAQQGGRRIGIAPDRSVEMLGDREADVESDEVGQAQRTHRMIVAELHRAVDVLGARDALLEHADRLETEDDSEPA